MVLTSHDQLGNTGKRPASGWKSLPPYYVFKDAGADHAGIAPRRQPPLDPKSDDESAQTDATRRFKADAEAQSNWPARCAVQREGRGCFDAVFYPAATARCGTWLKTRSPSPHRKTFAAGKPLALVCHAPGVLRHQGPMAPW